MDGRKESAQILVVDDEEPIRRFIGRLLTSRGHSCHLAGNGEEATDMLKKDAYQLVLSDMDMPGMSGMELIQLVSRDYPGTATLMCTAVDDTELAQAAMDVGAYGYVIKPFEANEIIISVSNALKRRELELENAEHRNRLEHMVHDRTQELWNAVRALEGSQRDLRLSREETIRRLSIAAEYRHDETGRHVQRMSRYCAILAQAAGRDPEEAESLRIASQMHDVGKIGTPDSILLKPGALTPDERTIMQTHAEIGYQILAGSGSELLDLAAAIAHTHHEKLDGSGYPRGLQSQDIPFEGRVAAIADVFDALSSDRVYKKAYPLGKAVEIMKEGSGSYFDPELLDAFLGAMSEVLKIKEQWADPQS